MVEHDMFMKTWDEAIFNAAQQFYIYGLISLKEHFTSPMETNLQQVVVWRRKWKQHARLQGIDLSPMHACGDWHLIRLSSWVFLSWMIAQVIL